MSKRTALSAVEKLHLITPILEERKSINSVSEETGYSWESLRNWVFRFKRDGLKGLEESKIWKRYSAEFKEKAVEEVLYHKKSIQSVVKEYGISSTSVLRSWIKKYNNGIQNKATSKGRVGAIMNKGRKTTLQERIEITEYTIARENDYESAQRKYGVSYQQVYQWVRKYNEHGIEGLQDRRGKSKKEEDLTEIEKLKLEIKRLEERNKYLEMQDAIGKKLQELEHRYRNSR